ncbi:MAG: hypothetical protein GF417_05285 [Candidatus Latescibacteria bacterium]|nr:hypothetical protein [bacterium]MBD3423832.1 hypothetical protein [Candidatus Latescibacterota bacterium]
MKKITVLSVAAFLIIVQSCGVKHPSSIKVDPEFEPNDVRRVLVAPVISSVPKGSDPRRQSEILTRRILWENLTARDDYIFISPQQFMITLNREAGPDAFGRFKNAWLEGKGADVELVRLLKKNLEIDTILLPEVYLWFKDEADYREAGAASTTQVGMRIHFVDPLSAKVLWEATDENFMEGVRTEGDRVEVTGAGGYDRRISGVTATGRDMYSAPPFESVLVTVVEALVGAIPAHSLQ